MSTTIIGMKASGTGGTENAVASIDIPFDGQITGVDWDARADLDADTEQFNAELSFVATSQLGSNDVRGRVSSIAAMCSLTTSGAPVVSIDKFVGPMELPVQGGERLYIHISATSGLVSEVRCNVHLDSRTAPRRRSSRRRD